jgi:hypothetical protein
MFGGGGAGGGGAAPGGGADACGKGGAGWTAGVDPGTDRKAAVVGWELSFMACPPVPLRR